MVRVLPSLSCRVPAFSSTLLALARWPMALPLQPPQLPAPAPGIVKVPLLSSRLPAASVPLNVTDAPAGTVAEPGPARVPESSAVLVMVKVTPRATITVPWLCKP